VRAPYGVNPPRAEAAAAGGSGRSQQPPQKQAQPQAQKQPQPQAQPQKQAQPQAQKQAQPAGRPAPGERGGGRGGGGEPRGGGGGPIQGRAPLNAGAWAKPAPLARTDSGGSTPAAPARAGRPAFGQIYVPRALAERLQRESGGGGGSGGR